MSLAGTDVPSWSPDLPDEQKEEALRTAIKSITQGLQGTGVQVLISNIQTGNVAVALAGPALIPVFSKSFVTSGGLVEVMFKSMADLSAGTATLQLMVDGLTRDIVSLDATTNNCVVLMYKEVLSAGPHNIGILCTVTGAATLTLGAGTSYSSEYVTEILL